MATIPRWTDCVDFIKAIDSSKYDIVTEMLKNGFDVDTILYRGNNGISLCVQRRHLYMAELLLKHGSSLSIPNQRGQTPLHQAVLERDPNMVELFLSYRADVTCRDMDGQTALHYACQANLFEITQLLTRNRNPNVVHMRDCSGKTPFGYACLHGTLDLIQYLVYQDAPINLSDSEGETPIFDVLANDRCSPDMVRFLVDQGADLSSQNRRNEIPLHLLIKKFSVHHQFRDVLMYVIERSDVNADDYFSNSILYNVLRLRDPAILGKVLNVGMTKMRHLSLHRCLLFVLHSNSAGDEETELLDLLIHSGFVDSQLLHFMDAPVYGLLQYLKQRAKKQMSLKSLCRVVIRNCLQKNLEKKAINLSLPQSLVRYLLLFE